MHLYVAGLMGVYRVVGRGELQWRVPAGAFTSGQHVPPAARGARDLGGNVLGEVVAAENHVEVRHRDRVAVGRLEDVANRRHEELRLNLRLRRQGHVDRHLIAVEIRVEGGTHERVDSDRLALDEVRLERLDAQTVQRGSAVQEHRVLLNHLFEHFPDLLIEAFGHALRGLDRRCVVALLQLADDERLEELKRHLLRQAALVQLQFWSNNDHGTTGVVHALAEEVLAEPSRLPLEHVAEGFEGAVARALDDASVLAVLDEGVDGFLEHPLLVADDDLRRLQLDKPLQAVVSVDDAAIEVVQVGRREPAAVQGHEGS